jgi:serine/threonine protein kinase/Tol biopolymer transport system component
LDDPPTNARWSPSDTKSAIVMFEPGTRFGAYEIVAPLGSGGMGEVYRAWDPKLGRLVALKVLSPALATDPAALARFEREARAVAALSHPNILGIYDFGSEAGAAYAVMELLEGQTLREQLAASPRPAHAGSGASGVRSATLSIRRATTYALQIAAGLAAAHDKGIVHRDLKPENIFITTDGRVKILDFGLAQVLPSAGLDAQATGLLAPSGRTEPGTLLGTVGYMSPEQVRGKTTDHRADIFAFGAIVYEALSGQRAFQGDAPAETLAAILKEDPPPLSQLNPAVPPALERIVQRCLEKSPDERFQSARDLAFALESLSGSTSSVERALAVETRSWTRVPAWLLAAAALVAGVVLGAVAVSRWFARAPAPLASFQRVTFGRGTVRGARFTPDGQSIVYGAAWNGQPLRMFQARLDTLGSSPLTLPDGNILAISPRSELAVSVDHQFDSTWMGSGTLARAPLVGAGVRELLQHVRGADWAPDGERLALVRRVGDREQLEFPQGTVLYQTVGYVSHARLSHDSTRVAFLDHPVFGDNRGSVAIIEPGHEKKSLTKEWPSIEGLAWSPSGDEIWFTASGAGEDHALYGVTLDGRMRTIYRAPATLVLHDIAKDGRVLLTQEQFRGEISALTAGAAQERDLSLLDLSGARDISRDGRLVLITQFGTGSGGNYAVYLQKTDGSPAVKLGEGEAAAISPDNQTALAIVHGPPSRLVLLPTGPGEVVSLPSDALAPATAAWLPDGKHILTCGSREGHGAQCFVVEVPGGQLRAATPEGMRVGRPVRPRVSPDGRSFVAVGPDGRAAVYAIDGGAATPIAGLRDGETAIEWSADGRALFVHRPTGVPRQIWRLDLASGERTLWREIVPTDPAGVLANLEVMLTPDGRSYVTVFYRMLSILYLASDLR